MPLCDEFVTYCQNFDFKIRRDHQKNFIWALWLWVGRWKEPILDYVPKNDKKKNSGSKVLMHKICHSENLQFKGVRETLHLYTLVWTFGIETN